MPPPHIIVITNVTTTDGVEIEFTWNGQPGAFRFQSLTDMMNKALNALGTNEQIACIVGAWWKLQNPELDNPASVIGLTINVNPAGDPVTLTVTGPSPTLCWTTPIIP
jgi:hypothetical protein